MQVYRAPVEERIVTASSRQLAASSFASVKSPLVSMSHSKTTAEKIAPKPMSRLKNFAAKTMRIFTAIWP